MADDKDLSALFDEGAKQASPQAMKSEAQAEDKVEQKANDSVGDLFDSGVQEHKEAQSAPKSEIAPQQWSKAQSLGQGTLQGATAGFSDELGGALGAGMEKLAGNPDDKSLEDLYREYRDMHRRRNESAQKQNPGNYLAGNIGGGIASAALIPGSASLMGATALGAANGLGASSADLTSGNPSEIKRAATDTAIGGSLGLLGGAVGKGIANKLAPKALQETGSEMAASVAGISPEDQAATAWVRKGDRWVKEPVEGPGTGQIAVEQGALPNTGGSNAQTTAAQQAIENNYNKLDPLLDTAQEALDPKLDETLNSVGHVGDKLGNFYNDFVEGLGQTDQAQKIGLKLLKDNRGNIEKLSQLDGNLSALNAFKKDLQSQAQRAGAYGPNQSKDAANFLKGMAGVVRQHIEDLANAADPQSQIGSQIKEANNNISKLIDFKDGVTNMANQPSTINDKLKSLLGPGILSTIGYKVGGYPGVVAANMAGKVAETAMGGQSLGTTAKIAAAKGFLNASKAVSTPVGNIVLRQAPAAAASSAIRSPFSQEIFQEGSQSLKPSDSTKIASTIYNADDASLKKINNDFKQDPSLENITNAMDRYLKTKDTQDLNVATFLILQNKNAIKLLTGEQ